MSAIDSPPAARPPSKLLLFVGLPLAALFLTLLFAFLRFPYERLSNAVSAQVAATTQIELTIGELSPHLSLLGPGFAMRRTQARWGDRIVILEELVVRPAWSFSWLRGDPAIVLRIESGAGRAEGTLVSGDRSGWSGEIEGLDLRLVPFDSLMPDLDVSGAANADIDLHSTGIDEGASLEGRVEFDVSQGTLTLPNLPVDVPFETLGGVVDFGGEVTATLDLALEGPMVLAAVQGTVGLSENPGQEPLDVGLAVEVPDEGLRTMLRRSGVRLQPDGKSEIRIGGTLARPRAQ